MTHRRRWLLLTAAGLSASLFGCGGGDDLSPPQVRYDEQECVRCGMIISEERFAAALVVRGASIVSKLAFDDTGCLLEHLREQKPASEVIPYVHDFDTSRWVDARHATFVKSDKLHTPMASELAACSSPDSAERLLERYPGRIVAFEALLHSPADGSVAAADDSRGTSR
jgi:copper chaperone NosL